jgi:hypothetical protein
LAYVSRIVEVAEAIRDAMLCSILRLDYIYVERLFGTIRDPQDASPAEKPHWVLKFVAYPLADPFTILPGSFGSDRTPTRTS